MTRLEDRQTLANHIKLACAEGARLEPACELAGIDPGTLRRWQGGEGPPQADRRPDAVHPAPAHALTEAERAQIIEVANQPRFADARPPGSSQRWPMRASTSPASPASIACCTRMAK